MPRTTPANEYERKLLENVQTHGWQCTSVSPGQGDEETTPFSYTIGMTSSFGLPEFITFGLPSGTAHAIFEIIANMAKSGRTLSLDQPCSSLINDFDCVFVEVPRAHYDQYVLSCLWFYEGQDFSLYQIVWPSKFGRFPWHPESSASFRAWQPVLGTVGDA
jgi:hypothetical protein